MRYCPVFLQLTGCPCLVIGGGKVAFRKIKSLVSSGAKVTAVSPEAVSGIQRFQAGRKIVWLKGRFRPAHLKGIRLVVAAANDNEVNEEASLLARRKGIWVNVVDQPRLCTFIFPSVVRRGDLALAVSTGGASPALAKWVRRDLENRYGAEFKPLLRVMARARTDVKKRVRAASRRKKLFERALKAYMEVMKRPE